MLIIAYHKIIGVDIIDDQITNSARKEEKNKLN